MSYKPKLKFAGDSSNYKQYPDSNSLSPPVKVNEDPFYDW